MGWPVFRGMWMCVNTSAQDNRGVESQVVGRPADCVLPLYCSAEVEASGNGGDEVAWTISGRQWCQIMPLPPSSLYTIRNTRVPIHRDSVEYKAELGKDVALSESRNTCHEGAPRGTE